MDNLDKEDGLMLENHTLRARLLDMRCEALKGECAQFRAAQEAFSASMKKKYALADGDSVDYTTLVITRAQKAEEKAA